MTQDNQQDEEILGRAYDARLMGRILAYLKPYRTIMLFSFVLLTLYTCTTLLGPYLTKIAIDKYIITGNIHGLKLMALAYVGSVILGFLFLFAQTYLTEFVGQHAMHDLRIEIFAHLQKQDVAFFDRHPVGRLMTRTVNDVETLNEMFSTGLIGLLGDSFTVLGIIGAMLFMNWRLAMITMTAFPLIFYFSRHYRKRSREVYRESRRVIAQLNANLQESIAGIGTIKAFAQENKLHARFRHVNLDLRDVLMRGIRYNAMFFPVVEIFSALTIGLTLWYGGSLVSSHILLPGVIIAFIQYIQRIYHPIRDIAEKYNVMQAAMASSERIFNLLDNQETLKNPPISLKPAQLQGSVEFNDVWLSYRPGEPVLKGISFKVKPGEKIALVGATGGGKTSIISALMRFYETEKGTIRVDGLDIKEWNKQQLRRHVGLVLQDVFLFSGDIAENINMGDPKVSFERVIAAARRAHVASFIEGLPKGYREEVQERGATLSQGQRQLLSFARALAFEPGILILDEATSSVDSETEMLIQDAMHEMLRNRTALIIAHRLSTIKNVNRILVIHKGEIWEEGTHDELLKRNGLYSRLYELQYLSQENCSSDRAS